MVDVSRFEVWLVELNPAQGSETNKRRPCVVVSPDELLLLNTVIVAPMTTKGFKIDCRVKMEFKGKSGLIGLDQIRTIDKSRLIKKLGCVDESTEIDLCNCLQEMFTL
jgi:mRNA interferase MazF